MWTSGFVYDGQLLRLAVDLGNRLLPAFYTDTGLPYPRVNLRHGVQRQPFYANSPLNADHPCNGSNSERCQKGRWSSFPETTETCSAGAGSLVLEFTVLSRLTGDGRYEELAKRAFWAVWTRRSEIGLIGSGIDAESGRWVHSYTGVSTFRWLDDKPCFAYHINDRLVRGLIASLSTHSSRTFCSPRESDPPTTQAVHGIIWMTTFCPWVSTNTLRRPFWKYGRSLIRPSRGTYIGGMDINTPTLSKATSLQERPVLFG